MDYNAAILEAAGRHLGLAEWPGAAQNPAILGFARRIGADWITDDETPWCATFVGAVLAEVSLHHSGSAAARSYLAWGQKVAMHEAQPGDVIVLWRGAPQGPSGHVGFLLRFEGPRVVLRGGNQGNAVSDAAFPADRILGIRRADGAGVLAGRATVRTGSRGAFVLDAQDQLRRAGYFAGRLDGEFGSLTRAAVLAFQADAGIAADGVVGPETWAALERAAPRPARGIDAAELRARGSETIRAADGAQVSGLAAGGLGAAVVAVEKAEAAAEAMGRAETALDRLAAVALAYWPALALVALSAMVWAFAARVREARVRDAATGRNLGR